MPMRLFKKNPVTYILLLKKTNQMHFVLSMIDFRVYLMFTFYKQLLLPPVTSTSFQPVTVHFCKLFIRAPWIAISQRGEVAIFTWNKVGTKWQFDQIALLLN